MKPVIIRKTKMNGRIGVFAEIPKTQSDEWVEDQIRQQLGLPRGFYAQALVPLLRMTKVTSGSSKRYAELVFEAPL